MAGNNSKPSGLFIGLATFDVINYTRGLPEPNKKVTCQAQVLAAGGPALNAAVVFAALGGTARLRTFLGAGPVATLIREDVNRFGVIIEDLAPGDFDPPLSSITVNLIDGGRQVVSPDGVGALGIRVGKTQGVDPSVDVVHLDGHYGQLSDADLSGLRAAQVPVTVDAGRWRDSFEQILPFATHVIASADFIVPGAPPDLTSPAGAAFLSDRYGAAFVARTAGGDQVRYWDAAQHVTQALDVPQVQAVCTIGAGDFFHGAFAYHLTARPAGSVRDHLDFAARVASLKCQYLGTRTWLESTRFAEIAGAA